MTRPSLPDLGPRGEGWFLFQVLLFLAILVAGRYGPQWSGGQREISAAVGVVAVGAGFALALKGVLDLGSGLTPFPRPMEGSRLVDCGAYGLVRHPIYGGLIIGAFGWGLMTASLAALFGTAVLWLFFDLKSRREEGWLAEKFDAYPAYRARTRRLIPWLY